MRKALGIIGGLLVVGVITALIVLRATSGLTDTAEAFFAAVGDGDMAAAERHLSADFRAGTTLDELRDFLDQTALTDYAGAGWSSRTISGGTGELEGTIRTAGGGAVPVTLAFVKEDDGWKIQNIRKAASGAGSEDDAPALPDDATLSAMAHASMGDFARAVRDEDFTAFHAGVSRLWRSQMTPADIAAAFASFMDQDLDLTIVEDMTPVLSEPPRHDVETGLLSLKGYYATRPSVTHFEFGYLYEHPDWRLASVDVELTGAGD